MKILRPQQLDQRIETVEGAFRKLGQVRIARTPRGFNPQTILITIIHPGWPTLPIVANMKFVELWVSDGSQWQLTKYEYDLFLEPNPGGGRYGFHWHEDLYHRHCWDPRHPDRDHHFKGGPIDLFAAFEYFGAILAGDEGISCAGLSPLGG